MIEQIFAKDMIESPKEFIETEQRKVIELVMNI